MTHLFWRKLKNDRLAMLCLLLLALIVVVGVLAPALAPHDPTLTSIRNKYQAMSLTYPLGTDNLGRCLFSRLLFGIRTTVFYSLLAMAFTIFLGGALGLTAGYFQGRVDGVLMRACDVVLSFPGEVMIFALVGVMGPGMNNVLLAVVLVKWAWYARTIRGVVLQHGHKNYVSFARVIAAPAGHVMRRHLLPVAAADVAILASSDIGSVVLLLSALSFLGLGAQPPLPEWGNMLSEAKGVMLTHPEQMLPAGLAIAITVAAFNVVGDFLRDVFDPVYHIRNEE
ncbi:peptide ABC transporter permease [Leminorella grimontii]|uniref:Peptide ABC transporter permease n=1 Tax=Leminorella grimontii TaxID=82981 RepID=A0AAV5N0V2_9GAMM|nr:nickel/cobalt ABC transporter permease [Leminorella grimontii]KFC97361.1 permease component of an ABC superfamily nickel transporter [Leminorella grimontii ATCC 33999 = DSM 5078]GKX55284.1 peptide ABC transporter permease [Leminorella grimontii]VFS56674.1 Glutathione transport system permease protein gsiD [Leminorella grimontii]